MKELSIEQKAKRYDEVVAIAKECITHVPDEAVNKYMLDMFPELKESDDEKVIRDIKVVLECSATKFFKEEGKMPIWYDRAVAWLEKQCNKDEEILILKDQIESLHAAIRALKEAHKIEIEKQGEQKYVDKPNKDETVFL